MMVAIRKEGLRGRDGRRRSSDPWHIKFQQVFHANEFERGDATGLIYGYPANMPNVHGHTAPKIEIRIANPWVQV